MSARSRALTVTLLVVLSCGGRVAAGGPATTVRAPDPASVARQGPAYRYPQSGWIVLHIEGEPYERGYQHGQLLAQEIVDYVRCLAAYRSSAAPFDAWRDLRMLCNALFLRRYEPEFLEEMKGIADGAAAAGAKFDKRPLDLLDIVTINSGIEIDFLESSLEATATGLEGRSFKEPPHAAPPPSRPPAHCSAFAATGPATADGKIVFGHITMWNLYHVRHFNIWLDVKPARGHRVLMQTFPGGIMSGMDYYLSDSGLLVAETTIAQTDFDANGLSLCSRIRKTLQYADSIDEAVAILLEGNNGLYSNEWLLADTKTNEIAMFELGTHRHKLWRSGKNEWIGGTEGFYWGCNNAKDLQVRLETIPGVDGRPENLVYRPSDRDLRWLKLYEKHKGRIDADFGFEAFTTAPICAFPSCDAKFTTTDLARELKSWAVFGPPLGRTWEASAEEKRKFPDIEPLVSNDWTLLAPPKPGALEGASLAVDLLPSWKREAAEDPEPLPGERPPAWHGTILPQGDADIWLAAGFAEYERIVALEKTLLERAKDGKLAPADDEKLRLALFAPRSRYFMACRRLGRDVPPGDIRADLRSNDWFDLIAGRGTLMLAELRRRLGAGPFDRAMDAFGRANAGKAVSTGEFRRHVEAAGGAAVGDFFERYFRGGEREPAGAASGGAGSSSSAAGGAAPAAPALVTGEAWSIYGFEEEPEETLIVYGTQADRHAQREAAERLQRLVARRWCNCEVPVAADDAVSEDDVRTHHLLLVGRPDSNRVAARTAGALPVAFGTSSFRLLDKTYANAGTAVIAAAANPLNPRYSVVLFAGLSAGATWRSIDRLGDKEDLPAQVLLLEANARSRPLALPAAP